MRTPSGRRGRGRGKLIMHKLQGEYEDALTSTPSVSLRTAVAVMRQLRDSLGEGGIEDGYAERLKCKYRQMQRQRREMDAERNSQIKFVEVKDYFARCGR